MKKNIMKVERIDKESKYSLNTMALSVFAATAILFSSMNIVLSQGKRKADTPSTIISTLNDPNYKIHTNKYSNIPNNKFKKTDNYYPKTKEEYADLAYTILDSTNTLFRIDFDDPIECEDMARELFSTIIDNHEILVSSIHPFNSFGKFSVGINDDTLDFFISIERRYTEEQIDAVTKGVDFIYNTIYNPNKSKIENLRVIHDYLIKTTEYDHDEYERILNYESSNSSSVNAYGPLFEGLAICTGYTDLMALFLDKLGFENRRVYNDLHAWNAVKIDGEWLHLDLTTDKSYEEIDKYILFLITDEKLQNLTDFNYFNDKILSKIKSIKC